MRCAVCGAPGVAVGQATAVCYGRPAISRVWRCGRGHGWVQLLTPWLAYR